LTGAHHRWPAPLRYVMTETCIAMLANAAIGGVITSLVAQPAALIHPTYWQAFGQLVMPTLGPASLMVPGITGLTRARVAKGTAPAFSLAALSWLPQGLFARTAIIGLAILALLGCSFGVLLWRLLWAAPPTRMRMVVFIMVYGAAFSLLAVPVVVIAALGDRAPVKRLAA
jgi:hypothetical protein